MPKVYRRTENGNTTFVSLKEGAAEMSYAQMEGKREVREMFAGSTGARITYHDGRRVLLLKVDAPEPETTPALEATPAPEQGPKVWTGEATRIITVKGKRYVVGTIRQAGDRGTYRITTAHVSYWSERNGAAFGATRSASGDAKPGTVGRAIWDAVNR